MYGKRQEVRRKGEDEGGSSGGQRGGEEQRWRARLIKEKVSDHASDVCLSGLVDVETPIGTSGGQLSAMTVLSPLSVICLRSWLLSD